MSYYRRFIDWLSAEDKEEEKKTWPASGVAAVCIVLGFGAAATQRSGNSPFIWFIIEGLVYAFGMFLCLGFIAIIASAPKRRTTRIIVLIAVSVITALGLEYVHLNAPEYDEETQAAIDEAYEKGKADGLEEAPREIDPIEEYDQDWYSWEDVEWIERDAFDLGYQTGYTASEDGNDRIEEDVSYEFDFKTFPERLKEAREHGYEYVSEYEEDLLAGELDSETEESEMMDDIVPEPDATEFTSQGTPINDGFKMDSISMEKTDQSSCFSEIGYDENEGLLVVTFRSSGDSYLYYDVPEDMWEALSSSESIGRYYNDNIKGEYFCEKLK